MIPVLTTHAGLCLTGANWQEVGVTRLSCYLTDLLCKPGYDILKQMPNLNTYCGWSGELVLNATLPPVNAEGYFTLVSPYDGRRIRHSVTEILGLIEQLSPAFVVLPRTLSESERAICLSFADKTFPFFHPEHIDALPDDAPYGVFVQDKQQAVSVLNAGGRLCYIAGDFDVQDIRLLQAQDGVFIETNRPAAEAFQGIVYCAQGHLELSDTCYTEQFELIDANCDCPTCSQGLTRAYLHHLFAQTPLLCQRMLIQHNVHYSLGQSCLPPAKDKTTY
jgi:queuine tRNA-ribosyltransferase